MDRKKLLWVGQRMVGVGICLLALHLLLYVLACVVISAAPDLVVGKIMHMNRKGLYGFVAPWLGQGVDWTLLAFCLIAIPGLLLVGLTRPKKTKP